ncbi:DUF1996 domain-containing protein [Streptomyces sp. H27-C3]|uniref:DUF1996 domain-containing protein n=1 Tax=Streptomyces sp. H27-C3 TaxID=3046305 RepID=UPI0024B9441C|nr:DUF1996 domain-containing protein [Streptomyces sp. H27-C3]MDJ0461437.1 DUF1996 domain-containing protein [Streptomyces sp. H27-C3]
MRRATRKRSKLANRAIAASAALILGGGGLLAVNVYASAGEGHSGWKSGQSRPSGQIKNAAQQMSTIDCPEVVNGLPKVPRSVRREVDRELAAIDSQITDAYKKFADSRQQIAQDPNYVQNTVLGPLKSKRAASIKRIASTLDRKKVRPRGLEGLAPCAMRADDNAPKGDESQGDGGQDNGGQSDGNQGDGQDGGQNGGQDNGDNAGQGDGGQNNGGNGGQAGNGPNDGDFVDIQSVQPNVQPPQQQGGASDGEFTTDCGVNENKKLNSDNVIAAPGVSNGAHHMHDYIGNQANDAFASDDDFANGDTTCQNQGDKSTYYWPVLRLQNGQQEADANVDGGGKDSNVGQIRQPSEVELKFVGSPVGQVTEMPRFLRIITGDAKAFTNGDANANASWSCTGFEDRQLKDKYPICPDGSQVVRTFNFQSCWDGQNTDSANHRTHVAFADNNGACPNGFQAIPQLTQRIVYDVPPGPGFAVDSFPEQLHKPGTDHGDFINVFDEGLMEEVVSCINEGRQCN